MGSCQDEIVGEMLIKTAAATRTRTGFFALSNILKQMYKRNTKALLILWSFVLVFDVVVKFVHYTI